MSAHKLVILRHAKAEYREDIADIERPLTARGKGDAGAAGKWLAEHGYRPDLVLCSPAKRTRQTWHEVALAMADHDLKATVKYDRKIYDGALADLLRLIKDVGEANTILLIGHNPVVSTLSSQLDPGANKDTDGLKTSGIAVHSADSEWAAWETAALTAAHTARG